MAPSRHLTWFGDGPMARSYTCTTRVRMQNFEDMRKVHRRLQSWNRRLARAELRTEERFWFCELPDSPDSSCCAPSSNGSDEDDFDYGPFIDQANKRDQLPQTGSSTTTQSWATGSRSETNQSWQYFGEGHSQDLWNPSEYHNWRWLPEHKRIIHRRQMDTTSEQLWIRYFPAWVNEPENPFPTSTSAKQKPVHCSAMIAREIDDESADMDNHAVPPPEYQAGGDSKRENLCQQYSERVTWTTPGASSSGQLEAAGASSSGRLVATEDPSSEKKVHLHPNDDGRNTSGSSGSCTQFQAGGARILQSSIGQYMCKSWLIYHQSSRFPAQRCDLEQIYKRLLMNFILAYKGSRRLQKIWYRLYSDKWKHWSIAKMHTTNKSWRTGTHFDGQELSCWVIQQQNWSGWKFTCQILFCVLESRIQIHPIIGQQNGSPRSAIHLAPTYSCFDHSNQEAFSRKPERANSRIFWWENHFHISVQRHWMDNERQYRNLFAQLQASGSTCDPIQARTLVIPVARVRKYVVWREIPTNKKKMRWCRIGRWRKEEAITVSGACSKTRRFSSKPYWQPN